MKQIGTLRGGGLVAGLAMALAGHAVQAENVLRGDLSFELGRNTDRSRNFKHISTSLGTEFGNGVGVQLDLALGKYEQLTSTQSSAAVHLYYAPTEAVAVGAYLLGEDTRPGNFAYYGAEVAYSADTWQAEAYLAYRKDLGGSNEGTRYGVEFAATPAGWNGFGLFGAAHGETDLLGGDKSIVTAGGSYTFGNDSTLALEVGRTNLGHSVASVSYRITFGEGARFSRRHAIGAYGAY
jgi:hypothetical protein